MNLPDYLSQPNVSEAKFADRVGAAVSTVRCWRYGHRMPGRKYWPKIIEATDGRVSLADMRPDIVDAVNAAEAAEAREAAE